MSARQGMLMRLGPEAFGRGVRALLGFGFSIMLLSVLWAIWSAPTYLLIVPAVVVAGIGLCIVARDQLHLLCAVLACFAFVSGYKAGFQVEELLYGLFYLGYLAYWFVSRFCFYRDPVLQTKVDWALFLFLVYVTASFGLTMLFGGDLAAMISEWLSISMLAFYFPLKEACARDPRAPRALLLAFGWIALFATLDNFWDYYNRLANATHLWQIAAGRVVENEHVLMFAGLGALVLVLYLRPRGQRVLALGLFLLFTAGVIISQSRAVWLAYLLGGLVIFVLTERRRKLELLLLSAVGLVGALLSAFVFFEDFFTLIVAGLANRFASLSTASQEDVSLINRFLEVEAAWEMIKQNPILGYGFGVPFKYYSIVYDWTHETTFIHIAAVGVWYRHGLFGLVLLFFIYGASLWRAVVLFRQGRGPVLHRVLFLSVAACLTAEALVANSANPFSNSDKTLIIALACGFIAGLWEYDRNQRAASGLASGSR